MRKNWKGLLIAGAAALCMAGTMNVSAAENLVDMTASDAQEETVASYLTGESVSEAIGRRRPVAVMLGNSQTATPQSGISKAGVIYEAPVEGKMTRLMAVFEDYDSIEKIGSVRSCRDYYISFASEFNAIYAHFGQAVYALQYLDQGVIDNLNGIAMEGTAFHRISERQAPHNAYTNFQELQAGIAAKGYSQEYREDYQGHYQFVADGGEFVPQGMAAGVVRLNNYPDNQPWFEYDQETKEYKRFQFGEAQTDENTGEQLTCDNIILQYCGYQPYDANGYLNIDTTSGGQGKYITRGQAMDITWQKDSQWGITHYYDSNGQEITLNTGKTWVEIVLNDSIDAVTYQ